MNKDEFNKRLGLKVRHLRKSKGLSQEELAERIEKTVDTISSTERGLTSPRIDTAIAIADVLDVPLYELFMVNDGEVWDRGRFEAMVQIEEILKDQPVKVVNAALQQIKTLVALSDSEN